MSMINLATSLCLDRDSSSPFNLFNKKMRYFNFSGICCNAPPLTDSDKKIQLIKMLCLTVLPVLGVWSYSVYMLSDTISLKSENEAVSPYSFNHMILCISLKTPFVSSAVFAFEYISYIKKMYGFLRFNRPERPWCIAWNSGSWSIICRRSET